jgi:hypothetical protein
MMHMTPGDRRMLLKRRQRSAATRRMRCARPVEFHARDRPLTKLAHAADFFAAKVKRRCISRKI